MSARQRVLLSSDSQEHPYSRRVGRSTILAWLARYEASERRSEGLIAHERPRPRPLQEHQQRARARIADAAPRVAGGQRAVLVLLLESRTRRRAGRPALRGRIAQRPRANRLPARPRVLVRANQRKTYLFACIHDHSRGLLPGRASSFSHDLVELFILPKFLVQALLQSELGHRRVDLHRSTEVTQGLITVA